MLKISKLFIFITICYFCNKFFKNIPSTLTQKVPCFLTVFFAENKFVKITYLYAGCFIMLKVNVLPSLQHPPIYSPVTSRPL